MRLSSALKLLALLAAALAVGLVAAAKSMDFPRMKTLLAEQVQAATGRPLVIAGPLELRLGLVPRVIATNITLGNPPGTTRPEMVKIERVEAEVALLPLLKREIRVLRLIISSPDVLLETDRKGVGNWSFPAPRNGAAAAASPLSAGPSAGMPATRFTLREVKIKNARLAYRDGRRGVLSFVNVHKLTVQPDANSAGKLAVQLVADDSQGRMIHVGGRLDAPAAGKSWGIALQGSYDGIQAKVEGGLADPLAGRGLDIAVVMQGDELGKVARLASLGAGDTSPALGPFKLSGRLGDGHGPLALTELEASAGRRDALLVTARGAIRDLPALGGVELALVVESDTLAGLSRLVGSAVPPVGPLKLAGTLSGDFRRLKLAEIKAALAGSEANGELSLDLAERPRLAGALAFSTVALADFITPASKPGEKLAPKGLKAAGDGRLFPADPIGLAWLKAMDAQLTLSAHKVNLGGVNLSDASGVLSMTGGRLAVRPFMASAAGGSVEGEMVLDASGTVPSASLQVGGRGIDLGRLLKDAGADLLAGGRTDARANLQGRGESWRALMASLTGETVVNVGEGQLRNTALDWAGGDVMVQLVGVLNPLSHTEAATPLSCAVVRFVVKDGVAVADRGIAVETAKVNVVGAGTVNLGDEHLDLGLTPRARDGIGVSLVSPLAGMTRLRGTLASPAFSLDELGAVRTAASAGAAVATGGLSLVGEALFDRIAADPAPCRTALGLTTPVKPAAKTPEKKVRKAR